MTLTACEKECKPKTEYVDREVIVNIPVKCKVPEAKCDFNRETHTEIIASMLECVINLKEAQKVCQ